MSSSFVLKHLGAQWFTGALGPVLFTGVSRMVHRWCAQLFACGVTSDSQVVRPKWFTGTPHVNQSGHTTCEPLWPHYM